MLSAKDLLTSYQHADQHQHTEQAYLLIRNKQKKLAAADLAAGRTVKITFYAPGHTHTDIYPARVAAFICKVLGQALPTSKGVCFALSSQGRLSQCYYATDRAQLAITALMSHTRARLKWYHRGMARWKARYAREAAVATTASH